MIRTVQSKELWKVQFWAYPSGGGRTFLDTAVVRADSKESAIEIFNSYRNLRTSSPPVASNVNLLEVIEDS
jgi:hypothetical protein